MTAVKTIDRRTNFSRLDPEVYGPVDADILNERYIAYRAEKAPQGREWVAFIDIGGKAFLPLNSFGSTEEEAVRKLQVIWDKDRAERSQRILNRREAVRKTAERKAKKVTA